MVGGTAIDATLNEHHSLRIRGSNGLRGTALTDFFVHTLRQVVVQQAPAGEDDSDTETDGVRLLPIYEKKIDPHLQPIAVQKTLQWDIPGVVLPNGITQPAFTMQGHLDLLTKTPISTIIDDHKFTSRMPTPTTCATSMQMWGYSLGSKQETNSMVPTDNTRLIHLVRRKREPDVVTTSHIVTDENRSDFVRMAQEAAIQIQLGYFPMTDPSNFMVCSPTQCGLWSRCRGSKTGPLQIPGEVSLG